MALQLQPVSCWQYSDKLYSCVSVLCMISYETEKSIQNSPTSFQKLSGNFFIAGKMTEKTVIIKSALDARQVAFFVQTAGKFQSDIKIAIENKKVSAKSIMQNQFLCSNTVGGKICFKIDCKNYGNSMATV